MSHAPHPGPSASSLFGDHADLVSLAAAADSQALDRLLDPVWSTKRVTAGGALVRDDRAAFVAQRAKRGASGAVSVSSVQACFADLAIVRTDQWRSGAAALHFLFKSGGVWRIAGEIGAAHDAGERPERFAPTTDEADALAIVGAYYRAVATGDAAEIARVFDDAWEMKNHEGGKIVREDKAAFVQRIEAGPLPGYDHNRHIADVQVIARRIAYVRVDRPSTPSTTVFALHRGDDGWRLIDKVWTDGGKD